MMGRKRVFCGSSPRNQLEKTIEVLGTPHQTELGFIRNETVRSYVKSLPRNIGIPFDWAFPTEDREGLDLLDEMLVFDPSRRITAAEALKHPYFADLYSLGIHKPAPSPVELYEEEGLEVGEIREMIWKEMLYHFLRN